MVERPPDDTEAEVEDADADANSTESSAEDVGPLHWLLRSDDDPAVLIRDAGRVLAVVALVGLLLFAVSGLWPPFVAVESGSMGPEIERGDLVFIADTDRFVGDDPVDGTGVVPLDRGQDSGHDSFGQPGDVIVFRPNGDPDETPIIHRAHYWVEDGENWVETRADRDAMGGETCASLRSCPAPHDGFVTKGDANDVYDQLDGRYAETTVVRPEWIVGTSSFRIPWFGHVRLLVDSIVPGAILSGVALGGSAIVSRTLGSEP